jgi:hypothetical protein
MILDDLSVLSVLSGLSVLSVLSILSVLWLPEMFCCLFCASLNMQVYYKSSYISQKINFKCSVVARNVLWSVLCEPKHASFLQIIIYQSKI